MDIVATFSRSVTSTPSLTLTSIAGSAFGLAEAACYALRLAKRPYVLTLRGGNLPAHAKSGLAASGDCSTGLR